MRNLLALLTDEETLNLPTNCVITKAYFDTQGTDATVFHVNVLHLQRMKLYNL